MSAFLDPLDLRVTNDEGARPEFELLAPFRYWSNRLQRVVTVPAGTTTDGASIPTLGMGLIGYPGLRAAVIHDHLVTRPDLMPRDEADNVFHEALVVCGVDDVTAALMYTAVAGHTTRLREQAEGPDPTKGGA